MPSGNCNLQKKSSHRPKMANTAYKGHECQVGKVSEEGRCDHVCPYMEHLWRVWHRQGPSSQSTCTIVLGKTTKYVMKIIHLSHSAYLLNANQIIVWHFFQPELKLTKCSPCGGGGGRTGTELGTCRGDRALGFTGTEKHSEDSVCSSAWTRDCFKWMEVRTSSFYYTPIPKRIKM